MFQLGEKIPVKFSGDGAKFSRTSNMMILSLSILVPQGRYLSGTGKCVCARVCVCMRVSGKGGQLENLTCSTCRRCMVMANCCKNINYRDNRQ